MAAVSDFSERIAKLEKRQQELKDQKIRLEEQLNQLRKQRDELVKECRANGVDPKELQGAVEKAQQELETILSDLEKEVGL